MTSQKIDLNSYKAASHSQYGEDGILQALFQFKGIQKGYFCEFGAWDGKHLSNTYTFYDKGWSGCYIEGLPERYVELKRNITGDNIALVCAFVDTGGTNSLDEILLRHMEGNQSLDLLSIDIDSDDLAIWKSIKRVRPKVVIIEYNPTIPLDVRFENPKGKNRGNSALSTYEHGISQGYELVAATHCNLIMIDKAFNDGMFEVFDLNTIPVQLGYRYFFGFDGTLMVTDPQTGAAKEPEFFIAPWSNTVFPQPIPRMFRRFNEGSTNWKLAGLLSRLHAVATRPVTTLAIWLGRAKDH